MRKVKIVILIAIFGVAFISFGIKQVSAACKGGDDGLHSDAVKGGEEGFHPG